MQRIDPRPVEPPPQPSSQPQSQPQPQDSQSQGKQWSLPTGFASTGSQPHTQSFEEIYGVPENFLEIEVTQYHSALPVDTNVAGQHGNCTNTDVTIGDRSTNTSTDLLTQFTLHDLPNSSLHQHPRLQATTVRGAASILRF
jgi:hypothetical protein